ncbi:MAG: metal-dependent hydrolase [Candidatus Acidiferrum sp.]
MDIATHALASYVLARGFFPRHRWPVAVGMILAGTVADVDLLSAFAGPAAYFATRHIYTDSILGTVVILFLAALFTCAISKKPPEAFSAIVLPVTVAAVVHLALDVFQSEGIALLWPFRHKRFAMDWLPPLDPWILALLVAGILVPELLRLVSSEIGARDKAPRGRNGAIVAMVFVALYIGARATIHSSSEALLEPHSYHGESAHHVGTFPDTLSIATWHGVVETRSFVCLAEVPVGPGRNFDPESAECLHKPEPSPELDAAQKTRVAQEYLQAMPFPRAVVDKTESGYEVVIRSMRDLAENETRRRVAALIQVDSNFAVASQELVWVRDLHLR